MVIFPLAFYLTHTSLRCFVLRTQDNQSSLRHAASRIVDAGSAKCGSKAVKGD